MVKEIEKITKEPDKDKKIKPLLVLQYLLKNTDENHAENADQIAGYLQDCGLDAERRSVYRDIQEINLAELIIREECEIDEARKMLKEDEDDEVKLIAYDKSKKGFYVKNRWYDLNDVRTLVECVYSAKFVPASQVNRLVDIACDGISYSNTETYCHSPFLNDRGRGDKKRFCITFPPSMRLWATPWMASPTRPTKSPSNT